MEPEIVRNESWGPGRWWRVIYADLRTYSDGRIQVWCETSNESEARDHLTRCPDGGILQRLYERSDAEWRTESERCALCDYPAGEPEPVRCPACGH